MLKCGGSAPTLDVAHVVVMCLGLFAAVGCGPDPQREVMRSQAFTVDDAELGTRQQLVGALKEQGVILKTRIDKGKLIAELYTLPAFNRLDVDQKSSVIRLCYFHVFGLPKSASKFDGLLYQMDGRTGEQLRTFDLLHRGLRFD